MYIYSFISLVPCLYEIQRLVQINIFLELCSYPKILMLQCFLT